MKKVISFFVGIGLFLSTTSVYAATASLQTSQARIVVGKKYVPTKLRPIVCPSWGCGPAPIKSIPISLFPRICPSWGCGTPPFSLVPVKLDIACQGFINSDADADCAE
jgi:hypothetical protein